MRLIISLTMLLSILVVGNVFATSASHSNPTWQNLGTDSYAADGVFWSTDGGDTWGTDILYVGQTVQFKFVMHKESLGTHYADYLKAWIDWNGDGFYSNDSEVIAFQQLKLSESEGTYQTKDFSFYSDEEYTITNAWVGMLSLLARVSCSESILSSAIHFDNYWTDIWYKQSDYSEEEYNDFFQSTGNLNQGEVEEWAITVAPVPEPATFFLLGGGLLGLGWYQRRRK